MRPGSTEKTQGHPLTNGYSGASGHPARRIVKYQSVNPEQQRELRAQLLTQRLAQQEAEHVAALFAVEQIEQGIESTKRQLEELEQDRHSAD
jgi:hypothetical protein